MLDKYFELMAAYRIASGRREAYRKGLVEAQNHPDYRVVDAEATRLYWEADALTPHVIRRNLRSMGVEDMAVTGSVCFYDGNEAGRADMLLSDLCGLRYSGLAEHLGVEPSNVAVTIVVEQNGKVIGRVDSDGDFDYEAAPDLRTALGWKIASNGGRVRIVEFFNLDQAAVALLDTIRTHGVGKEAFFGSYFETLKRVFVDGHTSRFGEDTCSSAATTLWHVATRELGEEHRGYSYVY